MQKIDLLKQAIRDHIEKEIGGSLADKAKILKINKGDLSRIMKLKVSPTLERIFFIEEKLKINILLVNPPHKGESNINKVPTSSKTYEQIQEHFNDSFEELIEEVRNKIKKAWEPPQNKYDFQIRKTMTYISVNLVPKNKDIGGFSILTFRYNDRKKHLGIWFIAPDEFLQKRVDYNDYDLKITGIHTTYHPAKNNRASDMDYLKPGQPVMYVNAITEKVKQNVCLLASHVYEIQNVY